MSTPPFWPFNIQAPNPYESFRQHQRRNAEMLRLVVDAAEEQEHEPKHEPEQPRLHRRTFINRDRASAHDDLVRNYFSNDPIFPPRMFRCRFRMRLQLFHRIRADLEAAQPYFQQRYDCTGRLGFSSIQKMIAALRILGIPIDREDEVLAIAETTATETVRLFCETIVSMYSEQYLRAPNEGDIAQLMEENKNRGFPGMIGSLDCMHWEWRNCPTAWHGQFTGHTGRPTLILEVVASQDLWIWHAFFGTPGTYNDISVLDQSPIFDRFIQCQTPYTPYEVNSNVYHVPYYLTDCIYPHFATLIQTIKRPRNEKERHFAQQQEACRKDVERAFGVLQAQWAITQGPVRFWDQRTLSNIMYCCIILHNMIIEDERHMNIEQWRPEAGEIFPQELLQHDPVVLSAFISSRMNQVRDRSVNNQLRVDLIEHLWNNYGRQGRR